MREGEFIYFQGERLGREVLPPVLAQNAPCPRISGGGVWVEGFETQLAHRRQVVIAHYRLVRMLPQQVNDGVGVGAVAHQIAQRPYFVETSLPARVGYYGGERFEVAVYVGNYESLQG